MVDAGHFTASGLNRDHLAEKGSLTIVVLVLTVHLTGLATNTIRYTFWVTIYLLIRIPPAYESALTVTKLSMRLRPPPALSHSFNLPFIKT